MEPVLGTLPSLLDNTTDLELFLGGVGVLLPAPRPEEDGGDGEHGDDDEDVEAAAHLLGDDEHLAEAGVERELHHLAPQLGQLAGVVERAQDPQLVHRVEDVLLGRRVHEVELQQVLHAQRLEEEHHVGQVRPLGKEDDSIDSRFELGVHLI